MVSTECVLGDGEGARASCLGVCSHSASVRSPSVLQEPRWMTKLSMSVKPRTTLGKSERRSSSRSLDKVWFSVVLLVRGSP